MNWATIAPETRLYKGSSLYRWEVSPGLDHHCGVCATPLHNARAKSTCIGKHVEPCYRFHQQLHFVGTSHECFGCNRSDEMHHGRHKEILQLLRKIEALDELNVPNPRAAQISSQVPRGSGTITSPEFIAHLKDAGCESLGDNCIKLKRSERKKMKKYGLGRKKDVELFSQEEMDFVSEAIHLCIHETKGGWKGSYVYNTPPKADQSKSEDTAADHTVPLNERPLADLTPRQRKTVKRYSSTNRNSGTQGGSRKYLSNSSSSIFDGIDASILSRLGVDPIFPSSAARKVSVIKLVAAIKLDLETISQEEQEAEIREEGFWRFAGRTAYEKIADTRRDYDWATGQKMTAIDETPTSLDDGSADVIFEDAVDDNAQVVNETTKSPLAEIADNRGEMTPTRIINPGSKVFTLDAKSFKENYYQQVDRRVEAKSSYLATPGRLYSSVI